jgi:hypothetical protein
MPRRLLSLPATVGRYCAITRVAEFGASSRYAMLEPRRHNKRHISFLYDASFEGAIKSVESD